MNQIKELVKSKKAKCLSASSLASWSCCCVLHSCQRSQATLLTIKFALECCCHGKAFVYNMEAEAVCSHRFPSWLLSFSLNANLHLAYPLSASASIASCWTSLDSEKIWPLLAFVTSHHLRTICLCVRCTWMPRANRTLSSSLGLLLLLSNVRWPVKALLPICCRTKSKQRFPFAPCWHQ